MLGLSLFGVTAFVVRFGLMAALLVAQVESSLTAGPCASIPTYALVECEAQWLALRRFCDAIWRDVDGRRLAFRLSFVFSFSFALLDLIWLLSGRCSGWPLVWIVRRLFWWLLDRHGHQVRHELLGGAELFQLLVQGRGVRPWLGLQSTDQVV